MEHFFIKENLDQDADKAFDLLETVREKLMTPDVVTAMQAGCQFDVSLVGDDSGKITISLRSREKVSILKAPDGTPISVLVKR